MEILHDPWTWAESNFATADLSDPRRTRRLVKSAARIAAHPEKSFTQIFDWNELRGFYRLCDQEEATLAAVMGPHWQLTRQEMGQHPLVLILHDTTELDFSSHPRLQGVGQIGDENGKGFLQHNSLAILPEPRQVLGLAFQQLRVRQPAPEGENTCQRKLRARESEMWIEGFRGAGKPPEGSCWVDVCDRGSDDYEAMRASLEVGHQFLFRVAQNRIVFTTATYDARAYLRDYACSLPSVGRDTVEIPGRGGRPARTASVCMASAPVWVPAPKGTPHAKNNPSSRPG